MIQVGGSKPARRNAATVLSPENWSVPNVCPPQMALACTGPQPAACSWATMSPTWIMPMPVESPTNATGPSGPTPP